MKKFLESEHLVLGHVEWRRVIEVPTGVVCQVWVGDEWRSLVTMGRHEDWKRWLEES